jgi:DNA repair protein RadC
MKKLTIVQDHAVEPYSLPQFEISFKMKGTPIAQREKITSSKDAYNFFALCFDGDKIEWVESFVLIALNRAHKPIGFYKVSQGGVAGTVADPKVIFQLALLSNASRIMVAHNHPSGTLEPSQADIDLTKKLKAAGAVLEIPLLDHLIVTTENRYFSFADEGLL